MKRLAVYSHVPVGDTMSSPGIRAYRISEALAPDFDVTLMTPSTPTLECAGVTMQRAPTAPGALTATLRGFDVVVAQKLPTGTARQLGRAGPRLVYDLYTPSLPEGLASLAAEGGGIHARLMVDAETQAQLVALATGDAFVCTSERQRDFWLGGLASLGRIDIHAFRRDPTLRDLVDVVPFGVPPGRPVSRGAVLKGVVPGIGPDDHVLLWAGGVLDWTDAETPIRAVAELAKRRSDVKLFFLGFSEETEAARRAAALARELDVTGESIFFGDGWIPYEERGSYLLESDLGVAAYYDILEARFAFRARLLDYVWAELPTITTRTDVLGEVVARRGLGRAVAEHDLAGWVTAIEELLGEDERRRAVENLRRIRPELEWSRVVEPLRRLAAEAGRSSRRTPLALALRDAALRARISYGMRGPAGLLRRQADRAFGPLSRP